MVAQEIRKLAPDKWLGTFAAMASTQPVNHWGKAKAPENILDRLPLAPADDLANIDIGRSSLLPNSHYKAPMTLASRIARHQLPSQLFDPPDLLPAPLGAVVD